MSTAHVLMGLLAGGPRHGYDLKRSHDQRLPQAKPLAYGQVYATLGRLERDGLVAPAGQDRDGGPDRTSYRLTERRPRPPWPTGSAAIEPPAPYVTSARCSPRSSSPCWSPAPTGPATTWSRSAPRTPTGCASSPPSSPTRPASLGDVVAADYAIVHLDADLRWVQNTLERVADLQREVHA